MSGTSPVRLRVYLLRAVCATAILNTGARGDPGSDVSSPPSESPAPTEGDTGRPALADASKLERLTLDRLLAGESWPRRAIATMRLERYGCAQSRQILETLLADEAWQVRAFAVRTLGRRGVPADDLSFATEQDPRVLRAALRHRYPLDTERLGRGVRFLARANSLRDKMLAVELGSASGDLTLQELAHEAARTIILRMGRAEAGELSPRLAAVTGQPDMRRRSRWHQWLRKAGRKFALRPAYGIPESNASGSRINPGLLAALDPQQFADLEGYIEQLSRRSLDLAICLDCTASMWSELAQAQGGIDDLMIFVGDVVQTLRVAVVAYRDRRDDFETKAWDFTTDIALARTHLWSLTADGGGDGPEAVYPALRLAYSQLSWQPDHTKVLVLVGDGPPRVGTGVLCVKLAQRAALGELTTHVIETEKRTKPVKHFREIAQAGEGRRVSLADGAEAPGLIVEIAGLTLGERFVEELQEFFQTYLELCR